MKYLSDFMEDKQNLLFESEKVFFAFSNKQMEEGKTKIEIHDNKLLCSLGAGMYCPKLNANNVVKQLDKIYKDSIKEDIKTYGIERIIKRELSNHECYYTGDITDCIETLKNYPNITDKLILKVYKKNFEIINERN